MGVCARVARFGPLVLAAGEANEGLNEFFVRKKGSVVFVRSPLCFAHQPLLAQPQRLRAAGEEMGLYRNFR